MSAIGLGCASDESGPVCAPPRAHRYSMLDGAARLDDLFQKRPSVSRSPNVAITDHGNLYGAYDAGSGARTPGVKPIIGMEGYYAPQRAF